MRKSLRTFFLILALVIVISSCSRQPESGVVSKPSTPPTNPADAAAWETYIVQISKARADSREGRPYIFIVPAGDDSSGSDRRTMVQQALTEMASSNRFPGNKVTIGGPSPNKTASVLIAAFNKAKPASLSNLSVLYIGDDIERARVKKVVIDSGATFRYAKI